MLDSMWNGEAASSSVRGGKGGSWLMFTALLKPRRYGGPAVRMTRAFTVPRRSTSS